MDFGKDRIKTYLSGQDLGGTVPGGEDDETVGNLFHFKKTSGPQVSQDFSDLRSGHLPLLSAEVP